MESFSWVVLVLLLKYKFWILLSLLVNTELLQIETDTIAPSRLCVVRAHASIWKQTLKVCCSPLKDWLYSQSCSQQLKMSTKHKGTNWIWVHGEKEEVVVVELQKSERQSVRCLPARLIRLGDSVQCNQIWRGQMEKTSQKNKSGTVE